MLRIAILCAALVAAVPAAAEDWRLVSISGEAPGRSAVLINAESINRTDPANPIFRTAMLLEGGLPISDVGTINQLITAQRIDCSANTIRVLNTDGHDKDGRFLLSDSNQVTQDILPGQPAAVYRQAVCEQVWAPGVSTTGKQSLTMIATQIFAK